ncbi:hypothetical protein OIT41_20255 (plasmid) [Arthrobacter sp. YA7-1]|uniref:hypothetical protein n=1 Tax=Arthrobacter sp. YA7-1 TaxID=2987701 RepID=UPI002226B5E2|nr:hypothetical protein [Arthrobacter sp. YA7-1]UYY83587.1 hypothetical protein OIT41_20255 [Arthrobacter sp. YA7-1]
MNLVFLHGQAASGKLTTARALSSLLGYPVFHNHLVVDLLSGIFPFGSEPFVRLREQMWMSVFADAAETDRSIIFTFAPDPTVALGFPARVREEIESRGGRVIFIRLLVSEAERERRVVDDSRKEFHKLSDVETLRQLRGNPAKGEQPPVELEIDTDSSSAMMSARTIIDQFDLQPQRAPERFPAV